MIEIIFRVQDEDGNFIGCSDIYHGSRDICIFNKKGQVLCDATTAELMKAMADNPNTMEVGLWAVNNDENHLSKVINFLQWKKGMIESRS